MTLQPDLRTVEPIERVLLRIVVAFRVLGWLWLLLLSVTALITDDGANEVIIVVTAAGSGLWTLLTVMLARNSPSTIKTLWFVLADGAVALVVANASYFASADSLLHGGYPISWVAVVAYAYDVRWALAAGVVLFLNQWIGMDIEGSRNITDKLGSVVFLVFAGIVGYGFDLIRQRDALRREAEDELEEERRNQIVSAEREQLADQLHDSVLQTLHAIRVDPGNEEQVAYIARRQERELRRTIRTLRSTFDDPFVTAMYAARDDVEDLYPVEIDMVCTFDAEMTVPLAGLVDATREAMTNAAKHSGAKTIIVHCAEDGGFVSVLVRDRGRGFDADTEEQSGIAHSIDRRMRGIGGTVTIESTADFGTEVELTLPWEGST